jgi:hypothetical protein
VHMLVDVDAECTNAAYIYIYIYEICAYTRQYGGENTANTQQNARNHAECHVKCVRGCVPAFPCVGVCARVRVCVSE